MRAVMMHNVFSNLVLLVTYVSCSSQGQLGCSWALHTPQPEFHLIRTCVLSSFATELARDRLQTLQDCQQFAADIHGLALNFVIPNDLQDVDQDTCIVYDCPELDTSRLETESLYDYYSAYMEAVDAESNITCVPGVGLFVLHQESANFSTAEATCQDAGGELALVTSHERTSQLSKLVSSMGSIRALQFAFVGMSDVEREGVFVTVGGKPLDCFDYRGWAPGHPRSRLAAEDCVVLDSRRSWRVVNCARRLPFICELGETVSSSCVHVENTKHYKLCLVSEKLNRTKGRRKYEKCTLRSTEEN